MERLLNKGIIFVRASEEYSIVLAGHNSAGEH